MQRNPNRSTDSSLPAPQRLFNAVWRHRARSTSPRRPGPSWLGPRGNWCVRRRRCSHPSGFQIPCGLGSFCVKTEAAEDRCYGSAEFRLARTASRRLRCVPSLTFSAANACPHQNRQLGAFFLTKSSRDPIQLGPTLPAPMDQPSARRSVDRHASRKSSESSTPVRRTSRSTRTRWIRRRAERASSLCARRSW